MSDTDTSTDSIDIEEISDGDVLHLENKVGEEEEVLEVEHAGHAMVWLTNDKRLFHEDDGEKWTYEGIPCTVTHVHDGSESPWADLFDSDAGCDTPADNR
ncbi:hypothetical protein [Halosimplex halobium]|uniref:hypothetical protein n=1 Tax=Halosimplex halobium TaxID=3396618 RepID=UPI003F56C999